MPTTTTRPCAVHGTPIHPDGWCPSCLDGYPDLVRIGEVPGSSLTAWVASDRERTEVACGVLHPTGRIEVYGDADPFPEDPDELLLATIREAQRTA